MLFLFDIIPILNKDKK